MKRIIGLICIFSIICSFQINSAVFDSPETEAIYQNYEESVLIQLGFIESDLSEHMTRLEFVEILLKMLSFDAIDDGSENPFTDISTSHSGYPVLKSAYNLGIMSGGLATLGIDYYNLGYQTGEMAIRILNGEDITTMQIETQKDYSYTINGDMADALGITIPAELQQYVVHAE